MGVVQNKIDIARLKKEIGFNFYKLLGDLIFKENKYYIETANKIPKEKLVNTIDENVVFSSSYTIFGFLNWILKNPIDGNDLIINERIYEASSDEERNSIGVMVIFDLKDFASLLGLNRFLRIDIPLNEEVSPINYVMFTGKENLDDETWTGYSEQVKKLFTQNTKLFELNLLLK